MPRRTPIIALLTDFGLSDHYVGVVKSVLLDLVPSVQIIDLTHGITPGGIREGAYTLWAAAPYLPAGAVVLAIVDPGVGTDRRVLMLQAQRHTWIAPDNGLLDMVRGEDPKARSYEPKSTMLHQLSRREISTTFHGRDVFAPLAGALARGDRMPAVGRRVMLAPAPAWKASTLEPSVSPEILTVDRFGNIVTNIVIPQGCEPRDVVRMVGVGNIMVSHSIRAYQDGAENTPSMIRGSSGLLEVVVRGGSASTLLRAQVQTTVRVMWS